MLKIGSAAIGGLWLALAFSYCMMSLKGNTIQIHLQQRKAAVITERS
ncbi:hypothetical protein ABDD95_20650 [Mucilaginibacter sp. PAMB04274]